MKRPLTALQSYMSGAPAAAQPSVFADVLSPAQQLSQIFDYQSYFDSTLLEKAILAQAPNEPIVGSTLQEVQIGGYAIGLHPSSETPVAIQFMIGGQQSSSATLTLKPGQVLRPHGLPLKDRPGSFSGFRWGLPFGWLGGGQATIVVFSSPDAKTTWNDHNEVIYHRARFLIYDAAVPPSPLPLNWPQRFPWSQAIRQDTGVQFPQKGSASISIVEPTRVLAILREDTLAAAVDMRMLWIGSNDFGLDSAGTPITTEGIFQDFTWPIYSPMGLAGVSEFPLLELGSDAARIAADDGTLLLLSGDLTLIGQYVDIVRYGKL